MMVGSEEKFWKSRSTLHTSRYRVTAQKPGPFGSSCQNTGAFSRSQRYCANGCPLANSCGDRRAMFMSAPPPGIVVQIAANCHGCAARFDGVLAIPFVSAERQGQ